MRLEEWAEKQGRDNYFSFEMKTNKVIVCNLLLTYIGDDKDRKFDITD